MSQPIYLTGIFDVVPEDAPPVVYPPIVEQLDPNRLLLRPDPRTEPGQWSPFGFGSVTSGGLAEAGFVDLGYMTDDGIQLTPSVDA